MTLGRPYADRSGQGVGPEGMPDPEAPLREQEEEKGRERRGTTDSGVGLARGPLGWIRGAWGRLGFRIRF